MKEDADFESHGTEIDSQPVSKKRRKKKKEDPLEIGEAEAFLRLRRDLANVEGEFGESEDLEEDNGLGDEEAMDSDEKVAVGEEAVVDKGLVVERDRPKTVPINRLKRNIRYLARSLYGEELGGQEEWLARNRPRKRGECPEFRPCPFLLCRNHLYLDVHQSTGALKFNFPDVDPAEMPFSCSLDVAEGRERTLEEVAALLNMTRERVRQIEERALRRAKETVRDPSRRLPDGGYLKWEDVEEYEDDECDGDGNGGDTDEFEDTEGVDVSSDGNDSGGGGTVVEDSNVDCVPPATPALDFSLDDEE